MLLTSSDQAVSTSTHIVRDQAVSTHIIRSSSQYQYLYRQIKQSVPVPTSSVPIMEEEDQNDPGIIVVFTDTAQIHQVLSLPSVANVRPTLQPGELFHLLLVTLVVYV